MYQNQQVCVFMFEKKETPKSQQKKTAIMLQFLSLHNNKYRTMY